MLQTKKIKRYKDVSFAFTPHPETGDVTIKTDANAIKQSIRNLVLTSPSERLFHPEKGCLAGNLLFEQITPLLKTVLEDEVARVINTYEPRAQLQSVEAIIDAQNHSVNLNIRFVIVNTTDIVSFNVILERTR
ncbi:hypothetical protein [Synechococcus phage BUCT-ZZ01]|nr:hypothetical protein [Synechococcus phage BUCT-ZZ01]